MSFSSVVFKPEERLVDYSNVLLSLNPSHYQEHTANTYFIKTYAKPHKHKVLY